MESGCVFEESGPGVLIFNIESYFMARHYLSRKGSLFSGVLTCQLLALLLTCSAAGAQPKVFHSPYYVMPREGGLHLDLSGDWELTSRADSIREPGELASGDWFTVPYPTSVQMANFKAGKLGNPYMHLNALDHEKLEQRVWYYRKSFSLSRPEAGTNVLLNFDGIDYFAKVWLNGRLLGSHEGIFGGPVIDITREVDYDGANDLLVEVRSANYKNPAFNPRNPGKIIKGWFLTGGSAMEPYFNLGMWRGVRIELLPAYHLERPFLYTKSIGDSGALVGFTANFFTTGNGQDYTLHPFENKQLVGYNSPAEAPQLLRPDAKVLVEITLRYQGKPAFHTSFEPDVIRGRCWIEKDFRVPQPKLWYPNGLGAPDYYTASIVLKVDGRTCDRIDFDFGIRTITQQRSAGIRTTDRWHNWQFVVNGRKLFIKGVNWMPVDALYDLTPDKYDWAVRMARNAGIQLFRVWGSALLENDAFYEACNRYGIMVWQDFNIANFETPEWSQQTWESQVCQNIFRLRNQPSLAVWCGGNEFNPYAMGNAASIGILERNIRLFDPTRMFVRASPDEGAIHTYPDVDPAWYRRFNLIPFVSETGMHSITDPQTIRRMVDTMELKDLRGMYDKEFASTHPEFVQHFAEYSPGRVPRMLSRASHIEDLTHPSLEAMAEATQVGAGEFYQIFSEQVQSNYPVTTGLMPWVYKRPWPVVAAIHLVDGNGQPSAPYYFLKRTYEPTHVMVNLPRLLWAPGDTIPLEVKVLNDVSRNGFPAVAEVILYNDRFEPQQTYKATFPVPAGASVSGRKLGYYVIPSGYHARYLFLKAKLYDEKGALVSSSVYWPRTIKQMEDPAYYALYLQEPVNWPSLPEGPWLKPTAARKPTAIRARLSDSRELPGDRREIKLQVANTGKTPAFMTHLEITGAQRAFFSTDNYFWLDPGEQKELTIEIWWKEALAGRKPVLTVSAWNTAPQRINLME